MSTTIRRSLLVPALALVVVSLLGCSRSDETVDEDRLIPWCPQEGEWPPLYPDEEVEAAAGLLVSRQNAASQRGELLESGRWSGSPVQGYLEIGAEDPEAARRLAIELDLPEPLDIYCVLPESVVSQVLPPEPALD